MRKSAVIRGRATGKSKSTNSLAVSVHVHCEIRGREVYTLLRVKCYGTCTCVIICDQEVNKKPVAKQGGSGSIEQILNEVHMLVGELE